MTIKAHNSSPVNGILGIEVQRNSTLITASASKINFTGNVTITDVLGTPTVNVLDPGMNIAFIDLTDVPGSYAGATGWFVQVNNTTDGLQFVDMQAWIEGLSTLDLSNVSLTLGEIGGSITFAPGTTIDRTNTDNSGIQNFVTGYTSNYDNTTIINNIGGTINNVGTLINNTSTVTNNISTTTTYDVNSYVTMQNLTVQNFSITGSSAMTASWSRETYEGDGTGGQTYITLDIPTNENSLFLNNSAGIELIDGVDFSYDQLLHTINFLFAVPPGEQITVKYMKTTIAGAGGIANEAYIDEFTATGGQTNFVLSHNPLSDAFIRVSNRSGLYGKNGVLRDYTYNGAGEIILNVSANAGDIITVQYISDALLLIKASTPEAEAGIEDTHYMTPAKTRSAILALGFSFIGTIITANNTGVYTAIPTDPRMVFKNGLYQTDTIDYTYTGTTLTFTIATTLTDNITFIY